MCCIPLKPLHTCFRGATTKKNIFHRKMAKKCQFLAQIRVLWVRLVSWSPPYPILRVLDSEKDVLRAIEDIEQVFQGRHHQKKHFSPENGQKNQFLAQISILWVRLVSWSPPYPLLRLLDSEKDVLRAIEAIEQVFQGRHHEKNHHFSPANGQKMPIFSLNQFFLDPAGQLVPPLPYFEVAGLRRRCAACHCSQ